VSVWVCMCACVQRESVRVWVCMCAEGECEGVGACVQRESVRVWVCMCAECEGVPWKEAAKDQNYLENSYPATPTLISHTSHTHFPLTLRSVDTHRAYPSIVAGVGAAVVDVGLAVGTHVARNTRAPVPSRTIISTGGSILAGGATLAGEKIWCVCVCVRMCTWEVALHQIASLYAYL